jgi:hypothetical protein
MNRKAVLTVSGLASHSIGYPPAEQSTLAGVFASGQAIWALLR